MPDVILPVLDEAVALPWVLGRIPDGFRPIVVDNGSTDGSAGIARELGALVVVEPVRGFGAACRAGLAAAGDPIVCFMDCDGSLDPRDLHAVCAVVADGAAPAAVGARHRGSPFGLAAGDGAARGGGGLAHRRGSGALPRACGPVEGHGDRARDAARRARHGGGAQVTVALAVMAKAPESGRVKTRLCPPCTPRQAAELADAALRDVVAAVVATPAARRVVVLDGPRPGWLPASVDVVAQRGDGLDQRLAAAFADIGPALIVAADAPQVRPDDLVEGLRALRRDDAVLGPAFDGGYWAIGLRRVHPRAVRGVPMSSPRTLDAQRERLATLALRWSELRVLRDVDAFTDAVAVARECPRSRFARALAGLDVSTRVSPAGGAAYAATASRNQAGRP
jgi:rSAM/selenodomain-associated transferase 1